MKNSNLTRILRKRWVAAVGAALVATGTLSAGEVQALTKIGGGYYATDEIPYNEDDEISSTGTQVLSGASSDNASFSVNLDFGFEFYDTTYNQLSFSSNGLITFGTTTNSDASNIDFTSAAPSGNQPSIAVLWDDWKTGAGGSVYYQTLGDPGNRRFVIQWQGITGTGNSDPMQFQAVLFEDSNDILLNYVDVGTKFSTQSRGGLATVGIRDTDGNTNSQNLQWSYNTQGSVTDNKSILYRKVPFEFSPGMSLLALGGVFAASRLKGKLQKRKSFNSEFSSN